MQFVVDVKKADEDKFLFGKKGTELVSIVSLGLSTLQGFVITTDAYFEFVNQNNLRQKLSHLINAGAENKARKLILDSEIPVEIVDEIFKSYRGLGKLFEDEYVILLPSVADEKDYFKYFPIKTKGEARLIQSIKELWASYFDGEYFLHRQSRNISHFKNGIAIIILKDLPAQKKGSIEKSRITIDKGAKISKKEEKELLEIEEKVLKHHYFSKKLHFAITKGKIYIIDINPFDPEVSQNTASEEVASSNPVQGEQEENNSIGGIATGVIGKDIFILPDLKYDELSEIRGAKAVVIENKTIDPHLRILLEKMGLPVVVGEKTDLGPGMVATVNAIKNTVYKGEFKV